MSNQTQDDAARLAADREMVTKAKSLMGEGEGEIHPHLCELLDSLLARVDRQAQEHARLSDVNVEQYYQLRAIAADAQLGAALRPHWPVTRDCMAFFERAYAMSPGFEWRASEIRAALTAIAPLIEQDGA